MSGFNNVLIENLDYISKIQGVHREYCWCQGSMSHQHIYTKKQIHTSSLLYGNKLRGVKSRCIEPRQRTKLGKCINHALQTCLKPKVETIEICIHNLGEWISEAGG